MKKTWAVGGFIVRVRSSSLCGTVRVCCRLNLTHTLALAPFISGTFQRSALCTNQVVRSGIKVTKGRWRYLSQPSTPWASVLTASPLRRECLFKSWFKSMKHYVIFYTAQLERFWQTVLHLQFDFKRYKGVIIVPGYYLLECSFQLWMGPLSVSSFSFII